MRFPVFRAVSGAQAPPQLFVEVPVLEQSDLPWKNIRQQLTSDDPNSASAYPYVLVNKPNEEGVDPLRANLAYEGSVTGRVISAFTSPDNVPVSYAHDVDGYLLQVTWAKRRSLTYT